MKANVSVGEPLTQYPPGSVREVWKIAFPLMLTFLSHNLMFFGDRLILAHDSVDAMNGAAIGHIYAIVFIFGVSAFTSTSEVFVGQYNGAKKWNELGQPVWQMIWFSLVTLVVFIPLAQWGGVVFFRNDYAEYSTPYFKWLMLFGPMIPMIAAVSGFFIGQGKTKLVLMASIVSNVVNLVLDYCFVMGCDPWIQPMGTAGAAIATVIAQVVQFLMLFLVFLSSHNRKHFGSGDFIFRFNLSKSCIQIALPNSLAHTLEFICWALGFQMMARLSEVHTTVTTLTQTIFVVCVFMTEGLMKAIIAIASNLIGARRVDLIPKLFRSSIYLGLIILLICLIPFIFFNEFMIYLFLPECDWAVLPILKTSLVLMWVYMVCDIFAWITAGILTGAGDTKFIMYSNIACSWLFYLIPAYYFVYSIQGPPTRGLQLAILYVLINSVLLLMRYKKGPWRNMKLTQEISP